MFGKRGLCEWVSREVQWFETWSLLSPPQATVSVRDSFRASW
jgi:hypothetical protein